MRETTLRVHSHLWAVNMLFSVIHYFPLAENAEDFSVTVVRGHETRNRLYVKQFVYTVLYGTEAWVAIYSGLPGTHPTLAAWKRVLSNTDSLFRMSSSSR